MRPNSFWAFIFLSSKRRLCRYFFLSAHLSCLSFVLWCKSFKSIPWFLYFNFASSSSSLVHLIWVLSSVRALYFKPICWFLCFCVVWLLLVPFFFWSNIVGSFDSVLFICCLSSIFVLFHLKCLRKEPAKLVLLLVVQTQSNGF